MDQRIIALTAPKIAIIQDGPVYLNLDQSLQKAESLIKEAAENGAGLIAFGETWLCGYPSWIDYAPNVAAWDHEPAKQAFAQLHQSSIAVPGPETDLFGQWAKEFGLAIGLGVNEKVLTGPGNGSVYNSLLFFNEQGELASHHRKLMPTYTEKLLYAVGNKHSLKSIDTRFGQLGGLICWEHWMPLARQAMHNAGEQVHLAIWPSVHEIHQMASRHYAFEGRCFVVAVGQMLKGSELPAQLQLNEQLSNNPDQWILNGGSCVIGPNGQFLLEPQFDKTGILYCEIEDLSQTTRERMTLDVSGHYQREDVFSFSLK